MNKKLISKGVLSGAIAIAYIVLVVAFMSFADNVLGSGGNDFLAGIVMLTLFVFSAAFMAVTLFGRPLMLYIDGQKKEALATLFWSLGSFLVLGIVIGMIVAIVR